MCHALLSDPKFFQLLLIIDQEFADQAHVAGCSCGGVLHRANYPRKPRACPDEVRADFEFRFSYCCALCRRRTTSQSVRFLGRRVYLALVVILASIRPLDQVATATQLAAEWAIPMRTLQRWRQWWQRQFPLTSLWQADGARFMPPPAADLFPASLLERFTGQSDDALRGFLIFLSPITVRPITLNEGR